MSKADVTTRRRFTRTPKTEDLVPQLREAGLGLSVLPTYLAVCDHANNKTGRAWPSVNRIAATLGLCRRTVERHLRALCEAGVLLRNHQRRGERGRFSVRGYVVVAVLFFAKRTVRHQGRTGKASYIEKGTRGSRTSAPTPQTKEEARERRWEGYEWLRGD